MAIVIEFIGGFRDGARLSSESDDPDDVFRSRNLYFLSRNGGELGKKHSAISHATAETSGTAGETAQRKHGMERNHLYEVVERIEEDGDFIARFKYPSQED